MVAGLHVLGIAGLIQALGVNVIPAQDEPLDTFDVAVPPPPEPVVELEPEPEPTPYPQPEREEAAASAKQVTSEATQIVRPKIDPPIPVPSPIPSAETAMEGNDRTQGASNVDEGGTGAGGRGDGLGSGRGGDGRGGGGVGGTTPSVVASTKLYLNDYPKALRGQWPAGGSVTVWFTVQPDGRATGCRVAISIGIPAIDNETCRLVTTKVRFNPAKDSRGNAYPHEYGYKQYWAG